MDAAIGPSYGGREGVGRFGPRSAQRRGGGGEVIAAICPGYGSPERKPWCGSHGSGLPVPRRRTLATAIHGLRSLDADCAPASCLRWSATPALGARAAPHGWRRNGQDAEWRDHPMAAWMAAHASDRRSPSAPASQLPGRMPGPRQRPEVAKRKSAGCRCFACSQSRRSSNRRLRESRRDSWGIAYRTPTLSVMETLPSGA